MTILERCWAKTSPESGEPALTVRDHCLIVGVVAEWISVHLCPATASLAPPGAATLAAAHDIGKISPGFQSKAPNWNAAIIHSRSSLEGNHAKIGQAWLESLPEIRSNDGRPPSWTRAVGGHHGKYLPPVRLGSRRCFEGGDDWPLRLREELLAELSDIFGPLPKDDIRRASARLHWITGFITFCDWIGSNSDWFPLGSPSPLRNRWTPEAARQRASEALGKLGWHRREANRNLDFGDLFPPLPNGTRLVPHPLQKVLVEAADSAGLYLVEAPMGMGKTEAALAAAYRRWIDGGERGLYFALPTQLTSNRIHDRMTGFLDRAVCGSDSLQTLIHGNAWLHPDRVRPLQATTSGWPESGSDATDAHLWFASGRRALLAPFGTGTIDQALMGTMAAKHSALRLFGLSGKVVVIDEVHSYDAYTSALVDCLISHLLEVNCSVIVLSATLTVRRRRELVAAAGAAEPPEMPGDYPLVTRVRAGTKIAEPIVVPCNKPPTLLVRLECRIPNVRDTWDAIAEAAEAGACVLVIRNTVSSAQETLRAIRGTLRDGADVRVGLIHSRFSHCDRQTNEAEWMTLLGRDGYRRPRNGAILVATQVVEQSVDIDADLLVTDPAPVDLVLQRLGRLHRHQRDRRPAGYETPSCWILWSEIDWSCPAQEIREAIGPSAWIYPPFALYQAERILKFRESVSLPGDIRPLLEASEETDEKMPKGAVETKVTQDETIGKMLSEAARERWDRNIEMPDTEGLRTRWNDQRSGFVVLLDRSPKKTAGLFEITTRDGATHRFTSGLFSFPLAKALHENAVRVPWYIIREISPHQPRWLADHIEDSVVAWHLPDSFELTSFGSDESSYLLSYSPQEGLTYQFTKGEFSWIESEEESWY